MLNKVVLAATESDYSRRGCDYTTSCAAAIWRTFSDRGDVNGGSQDDDASRFL